MVSESEHSGPSGAIDGLDVTVRPRGPLLNVWDVFDQVGFIGTLAESHPYQQTSVRRFIARRPGTSSPEILEGWEAALRFLVAAESRSITG